MKVIIVQHRLLHYRKELFEQIKSNLSSSNISLDLLYGKASNTDAVRNDSAELKWGGEIRNLYLRLKDVEIIFQILPLKILTADLVILMQENRIISNYPIILIRRMLGKKTAFWGHGINMQSNSPNGLREKWKRLWLKSVDWWFAYTKSTKDYLISSNVISSRITCLNNAVNVSKFRSLVEEAEIHSEKNKLGLIGNEFIGVFCGSIYKEKKIELLLNSCEMVQKKHPNFVLIVIGTGPDDYLIRQAALKNNWIKPVGMRKGRDKAIFYKMADVMLNPGLVGLHILDSFAASIPLITTSDAMHSPEYDYLFNGVNGLSVTGGQEAYADAITDLIQDSDKLSRLSFESGASMHLYTLEKMSNNFTAGIVSCLK